MGQRSSIVSEVFHEFQLRSMAYPLCLRPISLGDYAYSSQYLFHTPSRNTDTNQVHSKQEMSSTMTTLGERMEQELAEPVTPQKVESHQELARLERCSVCEQPISPSFNISKQQQRKNAKFNPIFNSHILLHGT
ncbi:hypothetical protein MTR_1g074140 [Medicago truncatula]|uniref:Uncharacterized protein n=1 Tax=Medicago truncatula TaxID=3880 RepID=A0A072VMP7_MEDTR|nr:hypothetical protein MTR_1g074140 [Medicago truncatula]